MKIRSILLTFAAILSSAFIISGCSYGELDPLDIPERTYTINVLEGDTIVFTPPASGLSNSNTYIITYPSKGKLTLLDNTLPGVEYTADADFVGVDTFTVDFINESSGDTNISTSPSSIGGARYIVTVNVKNVNEAPLISGTAPSEALVGSVYSFTPVIIDNDNGDSLQVSVSGTPSWMNFNTSTYTISGTPPGNSVGQTFSITYVVSDGILTSTLEVSFVVTSSSDGTPGGSGLALSGTPPATISVGSLYDFTPTVSNPNGLPLTFTLDGNPLWLTINSSTGKLSGTPSSGDVGIAPEIDLLVTDGTDNASLASFDINIIP